jgi:hypothetical protein
VVQRPVATRRRRGRPAPVRELEPGRGAQEQVAGVRALERRPAAPERVGMVGRDSRPSSTRRRAPPVALHRPVAARAVARRRRRGRSAARRRRRRAGTLSPSRCSTCSTPSSASDSVDQPRQQRVAALGTQRRRSAPSAPTGTARSRPRRTRPPTGQHVEVANAPRTRCGARSGRASGRRRRRPRARRGRRRCPPDVCAQRSIWRSAAAIDATCESGRSGASACRCRAATAAGSRRGRARAGSCRRSRRAGRAGPACQDRAAAVSRLAKMSA